MKKPSDVRHFNNLRLLYLLPVVVLLASCASYKQNIMFKVGDETALKQHVRQAEKNYTIQKNDYLTMDVYTNKGERIIDPDFILSKDLPNQTLNEKKELQYLVDIRGITKFPMVGELTIEGLTIQQAEELLQKEYATYYHEPFVTLQYANKRVVVLGAPGGQVIPLVHENMKLTEILAMAKGINNDAKAQNIRVLRGDQAFLINFSTLEGYLKQDMLMEPGDIVYVEPVRRPFSEGLHEYAPLVSVLTSLTTLILVISQF